MPGTRYLKDRLGLYLLFSAVVALFAAIVLLLPYDTVYVRDRMYLTIFMVTIILCVAVLILGTLFNALLWMRGRGLLSTPERRLLGMIPRVIRFTVRRTGGVASAFAKDALYLSKLKERSLTRWSMHLLILGGFLLMLLLDLVATFSLDIAKYQPMIQNDGWAKLWIRDFGFDLAGLMMLVGLMIAFVRRFVIKPKIVRTELPDAASVLFLLAVVVGGFLLEGMGIAGRIPGHETNQAYSFLGYAFSTAMPASAGEYYDQAWLVHGVMSAFLIAYIPFSKLFHMIATPIAIEVEKTLPSEERQ
jgi:nitrate reductase gamma subunit